MRQGACYQVDEGIRLRDPQRLTVYGGTFRNESAAPGPSAHSKGDPVFTVIGGSDVTLEAMRISGVNHGGYHAGLAFAGGIELEGTAHAMIRGVAVTNTFGDGITLAPLRGGVNHNSGQIVAPVSDVTIRDVTIEGVGRQGVTFAAVSGAALTDVVVSHPGLDTFDMEADQANEGAIDVTINRCEASGGILFFANGGAGSGRRTDNITVENCAMTKPEGGSAVLVERPGPGKTTR
ncbi:MAG TPA: right-handed parallel beta-helix repeat-containing protein, partial [Acidimicrobiales bacterium]|nr:right-handed parallel beta-helix repeat-containing protein [Acidimicrobiales bacterium]